MGRLGSIFHAKSGILSDDVGLVLTGGGARAAYQAGVLQYLSDHIPEAGFSIVIGVTKPGPR